MSYSDLLSGTRGFQITIMRDSNCLVHDFVADVTGVARKSLQVGAKFAAFDSVA